MRLVMIRIYIFLGICIVFSLKINAYSYNGIDCARIHNYPKDYAKQCVEERPFSGPDEWRYIPSLGYRKFSAFGAARRDWLNMRHWYNRYWRYDQNFHRF